MAAEATRAVALHAALTSRGAAPAWDAATLAAIEVVLAGAIEGACARWPALRVEDAVLAAHLARHLDPAEPPLPALEAMRLEELILCASCASGDAIAVAALERDYFRYVAAVLAKLQLPPDARDEALQELRADLLVSVPDRAPRIVGYSGRGALAGWLKVVATRTALRKRRRAKRMIEQPPDSLLLERVADGPRDPELEHLKNRYAAQFEAALRWAFGRLRGDQRTLLRMYVTDELTLAELGSVHQVNASTVSRWLQRIRDAILSDARAHLSEQLKLRPSEYESLVNLIGHDLHLSIARLLAEDPTDE